MTNNVENAWKMVESDLENYPPSLNDPIGDPRTYHKIKDYLFACVISGEDRVECKDRLYKLYEAQTDDEKRCFMLRTDLLVNALYEFYEYIKQNGGYYETKS